MPASSSATAPPLFSPDREDGTDTLGRAATADLLADLCCHRGAGTPFVLGLLGSTGAGKSALMRQVVDRIRQPGSAGRGEASLPRVLTVEIDAGGGGDPASAIHTRILGALGASHPALAEETLYAGGDPLKAARTASERVNDLRRKLDAERQTLDELGGRRARLVDNVLFDSPGARVEVYARQNRSRIEGRLRAFGLGAADPMAAYKGLVRDAADIGGGSSRGKLAFRALWGFKGQGTLLVLAILLLLAGWGCGILAVNQEAWLAWLASFGDRTTALVGWSRDHIHWLKPVAHAAFALAAFCVLIAIVRAIRFLQPIFRGAALLSEDLGGRRRDLDGLLAHQTRRVDQLAAEMEAAVRGAEIAERRVEARRAAGPIQPDMSLGDDGTASSHETAASTIKALRAAMETNASDETAPPSRIVVAIDELDRLPPEAAAAWLDTAQRLLAQPGFVTLAAFDRRLMLAGFSEMDPALASSRLGRCVQISYDLDAEAEMGFAAPEGARAGLDRPWMAWETRLLETLAPFGGAGPRNRKTFVNRYRVARGDARLAPEDSADFLGLAVALALAGTERSTDLVRFRDQPTQPASVASEMPMLHRAWTAAQDATGQSVPMENARRGMLVARLYTI